MQKEESFIRVQLPVDAADKNESRNILYGIHVRNVLQTENIDFEDAWNE